MSSILPTTAQNKPQRRRQSIIDILVGVSAPIQSPVHPPLKTSRSFYHDYRNLPTTKDRLQKALLSFQRTVLDPFEESSNTSVKATPENLKEELKTFLSAHQMKGLTSAETDELCHDIIVKIATEKKDFDPFRVMKVFGKFCLSSFDTITDILITIALSATNVKMAIVQGGTLLFFWGKQMEMEFS